MLSNLESVDGRTHLHTEIIPVEGKNLRFEPNLASDNFLEHGSLSITDRETTKNISRAARELTESDIPVAFPTETVYGLGADATRSAAVRNIFAVKGRPVDNPLIVHVHSLSQLDALLKPPLLHLAVAHTNGHDDSQSIPAIYRPLIQRFWPGPLTIILQNPPNSSLAQEVTAGLSTFGVRMPSHPVALALLKVSDRPLAAPSANASTKPSPTTAAHVYHDLNGRIKTVIDGGPCDVGVESTVVDGLSEPPIILRPGGVSIEMLRSVEGWQNVRVEYEDKAGAKHARPKAPGMKYKHYSPKARVILYEAGILAPNVQELQNEVGTVKAMGIIRTLNWPMVLSSEIPAVEIGSSGLLKNTLVDESNDADRTVIARQYEAKFPHEHCLQIWDIMLGKAANEIAQGLFAALRLLDLKGVDVILVEGIDDTDGDAAAAVMNRLRKAADVKG